MVEVDRVVDAGRQQGVKRDIQTKVMTTLFALFAEVERDLISERTREGLARARSALAPDLSGWTS